MRSRLPSRAALAGALAAAFTLGAPLAQAGGRAVHEWGTFTSMQGSDGVVLDGLHHEEEALPPFVYSRSDVRTCPLRELGYKGLEVAPEHVTEKMETPVIYVYGCPGRTRVRVDFVGGLLTQWYPVTDLLGPKENETPGGPLDMAKVGRSFLEWEVDVLPPGAGLADVPKVDSTDPWAFARIPDANVLRTVPRTEPRRGPVESEEFLFYRGLGRLSLPVRAVSAADGGAVTVHNDFDGPLGSPILLEVREGRAAFTLLDPISPRGTSTAIAPLSQKKDVSTSIDAMVAALRPILEERLVKAGLFRAEAEAMTRTWEKSYFRSEGLRLLYVVPRSFVDRVLPLEITPKPQEVERVLVGRLECLTPAVEREVAAALAGRLSPDEAQRKAARKALFAKGRFLEPMVRRALAASADEAVQRSAREVLESIRQGSGL